MITHQLPDAVTVEYEIVPPNAECASVTVVGMCYDYQCVASVSWCSWYVTYYYIDWIYMRLCYVDFFCMYVPTNWLLFTIIFYALMGPLRIEILVIEYNVQNVSYNGSS